LTLNAASAIRTIHVRRLHHDQHGWKMRSLLSILIIVSSLACIAADRYKIDQENRTVTLKLLPQEALFLTSMHHYTGPDDPIDVKWFPIEELSVAGSVGSLKSSGKQLLKAFSEQSRVLYTLTYQ